MLWRWNCRIVITANQCRKVPVSLNRNRFLKVEVSPLSSLHRPAFHWARLLQKVSQVPWVYQLNRVFQNHKANLLQRVRHWVAWSHRVSQVPWVYQLNRVFQNHKVNQPQRVLLWVPWNRRAFQVLWVNPWRQASHKVSQFQPHSLFQIRSHRQ